MPLGACVREVPEDDATSRGPSARSAASPATRKISGGAGLVFKGSGFYITDYGKDGQGPEEDA